MPVEEKIKSLTEALAWETKRREGVERLAVDAFKRRRELEAQQKDKEPAEAEAPTEGAAPAEEAAGFNLSTDTVDYGLESPAPAEPAVPAQSELIAEEASL